MGWGDVYDVSVINLTQNYGGTNALLPLGGDLSSYILMIFNSSDWEVGNCDNTYAIAMTELDDSGNWQVSPLSIVPGTYHLIIRNNFGITTVFRPYLSVTGPYTGITA